MRTATATLALSFLALVVGCSVGSGSRQGPGFQLALGASGGAPRPGPGATSCPHATPACASCRGRGEERGGKDAAIAAGAAGLAVAIAEAGEDQAPGPYGPENIDHKDPSTTAPPPAKPLKPVRITVAHTAGHSEEDNTDDATWTELKSMMAQFGFDLTIKRDPGKSLIKTPLGQQVLTDQESAGDQCWFKDLLEEHFKGDPRADKKTNRYDFFLVITDYVYAQAEFRIGFDFGKGIGIAAAKENADWRRIQLTPEKHEGAHYVKESSHGRAILLFHEIIHHITGEMGAQHESDGMMAKYSPNPGFFVGPYFGEELAKSGGFPVADLKKAGLCKDGVTLTK